MLDKSQKFKIDKSVLEGKRVAIVRSLYNENLTESLQKACKKTLVENGLDEGSVSTYEVPGALEIPIVCRLLAKEGFADVIIALGVIVKGETYHFELVANECARGCTIVSQEFSIPVIFEVLAVYSMDQAKKRCGNDDNNKGKEAAFTALRMLEIVNSL